MIMSNKISVGALQALFQARKIVAEQMWYDIFQPSDGITICQVKGYTAAQRFCQQNPGLDFNIEGQW